ncbi:MAG: tetratricopeptide repeat protein [Sphingobacteriaceae bacterium]|nr:tetratricopeptide repeat protein [Sphingobacteriaceae bacterium]
MRKQFFALFVIISTSLGAQNFDSLVFACLKIPADTEKVNVFYKEGFKARVYAPQYAYNCAKQAEFFATQSGSQKHLAKAYNLIGVLYYRKGDLKKALAQHQKALEIREAIKDERGIAMSETNLGNIYTDLQKNEMAERSYMKALQINHKLNNEKQSANCYINIGVLKMGEKKLEESEKYFLNAYKIAKNTMDYELEAMCLNNLAVINIEGKNYESAIGNCLDALKANEIMGNEMDKTDSYINLARAYYRLNDEKNCDFYVNKADSLCRVFDYLDAKCKLLLLKSGIAEGKDPVLALHCYKVYISLKDSIEKENRLIVSSNDFNDEKIESTDDKHHFSFPYLMLFLIVVLCFAVIFIIYKNKR